MGGSFLTASAEPVEATSLAGWCSPTVYQGFVGLDSSDITLNGAAAVVDSGDGQVLRVTPHTFGGVAGSAFSSRKINLLNDGSFSTSFTFRFSNQTNGGADGLVFTIQNLSNNAMGGGGGGIGFRYMTPSVGVEFDNWANGEPGANDIDGNHVGIDLNSDIGSVTQRSLAEAGIYLDEGQATHAWVEYDGATDLMAVRVSNSPTRPANPFLTWTVDLPTQLGGADGAFIGFTSGTGASQADHDVIDWAFSQSRYQAGPFLARERQRQQRLQDRKYYPGQADHYVQRCSTQDA